MDIKEIIFEIGWFFSSLMDTLEGILLFILLLSATILEIFGLVLIVILIVEIL